MNLPIEAANLRVSYVQRHGEEYSSSCPKCGGSVHRNGDWPDRFRIWTRSRVTGGILGWCRRCGYIWTPKGEKLTPEQQQAWIDERKHVEDERKRSAERALENLRREQAWIKYHDNLDGEIRQYFYDRRLPDEWIDYWMLGYNPEKIIYDNQGEYTSPTLTIPIFLPEQPEPITIRNRILEPRIAGDKYRPEFGHLPSSLFYVDHTHKAQGRALIVEGEFKAMTTHICIGDPDLHIVGTPGKTPSEELLKSQLKDCEIIYLLLDPDAYVSEQRGRITPVRRMIDIFGERSRIMQLPYKVDDMLLSGQLTKKELLGLMQTARRIKL